MDSSSSSEWTKLSLLSFSISFSLINDWFSLNSLYEIYLKKGPMTITVVKSWVPDVSTTMRVRFRLCTIVTSALEPSCRFIYPSPNRWIDWTFWLSGHSAYINGSSWNSKSRRLHRYVHLLKWHAMSTGPLYSCWSSALKAISGC